MTQTPANSPNTQTTDAPPVLDPDEARAGRKVSYMPWILGISTVTAVLIMFFVFAGFAA